MSDDVQNRLLVAGNYVKGNAATSTVTGDSTLIVEENAGITNIDGYVLGGSYVVDSDYTCNGNVNVSIASGTYQRVAGGGLITSEDAHYAHEGNINMTITGGTFQSGGNGFVFGGICSTKKAYVTTNVTITGDISMTFDSSANNITLNTVYGGCNGDGSIDGNITITFTGLGSRLTFAGNSAGVVGDNLSSIHKKGVVGDHMRTLAFDNFEGNFGAPVAKMFDRISFSSSTVSTNVKNLSAVKTWEFSVDSSLTWTEANEESIYNNFSGDTLDFANGEDPIDVVGGTIAFFSTNDERILDTGWADFAAVKLFGSSADKMTDNGVYWSTGEYTLTKYTNEGTYSLVVTRIA